ncbi:hypothetical protein L208DRAFT_1407137 [Tricholoma matsutake]|nr:hypothetical protein L208DRAFT_1407137 [Tricholoma matsutake 945]
MATQCNHYAMAEFAWMTWLYCIASTFLILRVYVLSRKNKYIVTILVCHLLAQIGIALRILSFRGHVGLKEDIVVPRKHPHPHDHNPDFKEHKFEVCMLSLDRQRLVDHFERLYQDTNAVIQLPILQCIPCPRTEF